MYNPQDLISNNNTDFIFSSLPDVPSSQFNLFAKLSESDIEKYKLQEKEDQSDCGLSQAGSTSVSQSPIRQPNSPQKDYALQSPTLYHTDSSSTQVTTRKISRITSHSSLLSEDDNESQSQYSYNHSNSDVPINSKRKSNICLSRENILKTWTPEDDKQLIKLADQYKNDWKKIAKRIITNNKKKVTPNFLKNRYKEIAGDHIKKGVKFTHEEDLLIAQLFQEYGTAWTTIASYFPDRTPVMIKNRYYSHIRRKGLLGELVNEAVGGKTGDYHVQEQQQQEQQFQEVETPIQPLAQDQQLHTVQPEPENDYALWFSRDNEVRCFDLTETFYEMNGFLPEDELQVRITPYRNNFLF